jgi:hypothetical protein
MIKGFVIQDTIKQQKLVGKDTIKHLPDTSVNKTSFHTDSSGTQKVIHIQPVLIPLYKDTLSSCSRNSIADVTFYDSANITTRIDEKLLQNFPFVFTKRNNSIREETKTELVKHLRSGEELPNDLFHNDWALPVILLSTCIYAVIKSESGNFFRGILKFISFRSIKETSSREAGLFFQWQSILFNLASFINISLFAFFTSVWYDVPLFNAGRFINWIILLSIIISAFTLRHFLCIVTGNMSGEREVFRDYLRGIYQAYRIAGLLLLILIVLILYTAFIPVNILFYTGFSLIVLLYSIRVLHLFLIFINRHVSIFYLILYLCALEILPVVILVKYVTGLV